MQMEAIKAEKEMLEQQLQASKAQAAALQTGLRKARPLFSSFVFFLLQISTALHIFENQVNLHYISDL
jgi:hypothetical protein